jgi:hypothetical protein
MTPHNLIQVGFPLIEEPQEKHLDQLINVKVSDLNPPESETLDSLLRLASRISTREGFVSEYMDRLSRFERKTEVYWSVEADHMKIFGRTRYNGYEVFASVLSKWNKKRMSKRHPCSI